MIKPLGALLVFSGVLVSGQALALSVSATASDNAYGVQASQTVFPGFRAGIGYLSTDDSGRDARIYTGSLMFSPALPLLDLSVGGRYQYQDTDYGDGGGVGLGGSAFISTPIPTLSVGGYGFYTPDGLTHGDVDDSYEYGVQARARLFSQTYVHGGYRYLRSDFAGSGAETLHSGPVFGVSVGF